MPSKDFTTAVAAVEAEPVEVTIDADTFVCVPIDRAPAHALVDLTAVAGLNEKDPASVGPAVSGILGFVDMVMMPDSAKRFAERMRSPKEPITLEQATDVAMWLVGVYYGRPTEPPSRS